MNKLSLSLRWYHADERFARRIVYEKGLSKQEVIQEIVNVLLKYYDGSSTNVRDLKDILTERAERIPKVNKKNIDRAVYGLLLEKFNTSNVLKS